MKDLNEVADEFNIQMPGQILKNDLKVLIAGGLKSLGFWWLQRCLLLWVLVWILQLIVLLFLVLLVPAVQVAGEVRLMEKGPWVQTCRLSRCTKYLILFLFSLASVFPRDKGWCPCKSRPRSP